MQSQRRPAVAALFRGVAFAQFDVVVNGLVDSVSHNCSNTTLWRLIQSNCGCVIAVKNCQLREPANNEKVRTICVQC
jgi:hypothetical protein